MLALATGCSPADEVAVVAAPAEPDPAPPPARLDELLHEVETVRPGPRSRSNR
jgi:hypothetical protein